MASFELRYSPFFYEDLDNITDYLLFELKNELAAKTLVNDVEVAIKKRLANPLGTMPYPSIGSRPHPYRRVMVGNYLIFYVVIDNVMIVRRMLYGRRDLARTLQ
ncbi:MAG TPA: type II toxin-antitoxin system RelE/ParE family toxin [Candidatus Saccharimonadales bacterium]|jgi:plasmid stabilization system protein ParE|nr:type II toxin-antitoxin system RelE/ParE family toxin [Candidatus Saccharimonadales bacterium]